MIVLEKESGPPVSEISKAVFPNPVCNNLNHKAGHLAGLYSKTV